MDPELMKLFADRFQRASDKEKGFTDMLKERRGFVQGQENNLGDQVRSSIVSGSNGVPINPVEALGDFVGYHTDNANKTAQLTQEGFGFGNQAQSALEALAQMMSASAGRNLQSEELNLKKEEQNRKNFESGYNPNGKKGEVNGRDAIAKVIQQQGQDLLSDAPDDKTKQLIAQDILAAGGVDKYRKKAPLSKTKQDMVKSIDELLANNTSSFTGALRDGDSRFGPLLDKLMFRDTSGTKATINNLKANLALLSAGKIQGQGSVSEAERKLLNDASSKLNSNKNLSDTKFKDVLKELRKTLAPGQSISGDNSKTKVGGYVIEEIN